MKKIIPLVLVLFLLTGCKIKDYTPEIPDTFTQKATVTSGAFSYQCEICRNNANITVTAVNTNAAGMSMTYDGTTLSFLYDEMLYNLEADNFEKTNCAIAVYEALQNASSSESISRLDTGFRYEGTTSLGDYILIQNDDKSFKSLSFRNESLVIEFEP